MNTILLNTLSDGKVVIRKEGNGGGTPSGGGNTMRYYAASDSTPEGALGRIGLFSAYTKVVALYDRNLVYAISPLPTLLLDVSLEEAMSSVIAVAIDLNRQIYVGDSWYNPLDLLELEDVSQMSSLFKEITEEEFYDANNLHK